MHVVLLTAAALVAALSLAQPALAENGTGAPAADTSSPPAATETESTPAESQPAADTTTSTEAPTTEPEPSPEPTPEPTSEPPPPPAETPSEPVKPAPTEEPPPVTMEPTPTACLEGGAEGAQAGTCETAATAGTAESPQAAACDAKPATDGAEAASTCPQAESAPASTATAPTVAATTAPAAAPAASVVLVVSLAPEQPAADPAEAEAAAGLEEPSAQAGVEELAPLSDARAVELAPVPVPVARLAELEPFHAGAGGTWPVPAPVPPLGMTSPPYLPAVNGVIATGTMVQGARASPRERDGSHNSAVATKAEEQEPPSAGVSPSGPLENQGLGAPGGSAGDVPGAASSRHFAIATTPLRFEFPSTFAHAPLPSRVPEGALADAPTTRPG